MILYNEHLSVNTKLVEQGSDLWLLLRVGVLSASRVYDAISKGKTGKYKAARQSYIMELVSEIITGKSKSLNARSLSWGKEYEPEARDLIEFDLMEVVEEYGFIYKDELLRVGASPDGILKGKREGVEIKCPYATDVHLNLILNDEIKEMYRYQCQFSLWVSGFEKWNFYSYDPRVKIDDLRLIKNVYEIDYALFREFDKEIPLFLEELDQTLNRLGVSFGDQWK